MQFFALPVKTGRAIFLPFFRPHSWPFSPKSKFQKLFSNLPKLFPTFLYLEAEKATD